MKTQHDILMGDSEFRKLLSIETLTANASELIAKLMAEQGVSKADLARRLAKSRAWVTQLLSGKTNMTVRTLAEVAYELGAEVKVHGQTLASSLAEEHPGSGWPAGIRFRLEPESDCLPDEGESVRPIAPEYAA